ncbi:hypothetical protein LTR41_011791 [Exophiala xenobiotica]|nr:hypothetical protein LTR41_011791 [Exophiala xenobiotica]KAK5550355.1 hypothetical protein LTR46_011642 [Exophiala xenobiotica]
MAAVVLAMLHELDLAPKLLTITGDNAGNNGTLCDMLYAELSNVYDDEDKDFRLRSLVRFHGRASFVRCLEHVINQLGVGSVIEAKSTLDQARTSRNRWPSESSANAPTEKNVVVKFHAMEFDLHHNSRRAQLRKELTQYIWTHLEIKNLLPSEDDGLLLGQIERVLKHFWDYTNVVSSDMPAITDSLAIYWSLDDLLTDVSTAQGDFRNIHVSVREQSTGGASTTGWDARLIVENFETAAAGSRHPDVRRPQVS